MKSSPCFIVRIHSHGSLLRKYSICLFIYLFFLTTVAFSNHPCMKMYSSSRSGSVQFSFTNFWSDVSDTITFQGDAHVSAGTLQLTKTDEDGAPVHRSVGRALYDAPVHLWQRSTGRLASFYTTFSFVLKATTDNPSDGLSFFIAPLDSDVKGIAGVLGLFDRDTALDPSKNQVVAVEFDTWVNNDLNDPPYRHIGIDVNRIQSEATVRWKDSDVLSGSVATAHISYDPFSKTLSVVVTYPNGGHYALAHEVDLTTVLPEWVRVGFSGATGQFETQYILTWHFSSTLQNNTGIA